MMDIKLFLEGDDATERTLLAVQDWIRHEHIEGLAIQPNVQDSKPNEMGAGETALSIGIKHGKTLSEIVKSLYKWITLRRPSLRVKIQMGENKIFELDAESLPEQQKVIDDIIDIVKNLSYE